jgi:hypothetical protein
VEHDRAKAHRERDPNRAHAHLALVRDDEMLERAFSDGGRGQGAQIVGREVDEIRRARRARVQRGGVVAQARAEGAARDLVRVHRDEQIERVLARLPGELERRGQHRPRGHRQRMRALDVHARAGIREAPDERAKASRSVGGVPGQRALPGEVGEPEVTVRDQIPQGDEAVADCAEGQRAQLGEPRAGHPDGGREDGVRAQAADRGKKLRAHRGEKIGFSRCAKSVGLRHASS